MNWARVRAAQDAVEAARPAIERLDAARNTEENAADLIEAWNAAQDALRSLLGVSTLNGHGLIREARTRNLLTLDQAHALVAFSAAAERAREPSYEPTEVDLEASRAGLQQLDAALEAPVGIGEPDGVTSERSTSPEPPVLSGTGTSDEYDPVPPAGPPRRNVLGMVLVAVALVVTAGAVAWYAINGQRGPAHMRRGVEAYQRGDRETAAREFMAASERMPRAALPHVYLARLAREAGNAATVARELETAIRLEPENALALREMGAHALAIGDLELARRFYVRALERDPSDRNALGFLGCTLLRLGRWEEAQRFLERAGPGDWTACVTPPPQAVPR